MFFFFFFKYLGSGIGAFVKAEVLESLQFTDRS